MKLSLLICGYGASAWFGTLSDEIVRYIETLETPDEYRVKLENGEVPVPFRIGDQDDCLEDVADLGEFGPRAFADRYCTVEVSDEAEKIVFRRRIRDLPEECLAVSSIELAPGPGSRFPGATHFWSFVDDEKGAFEWTEIETDAFDLSKLKVFVQTISVCGKISFRIINRVEYDGTRIDGVGDETRSQGCEFEVFPICRRLLGKKRKPS